MGFSSEVSQSRAAALEIKFLVSPDRVDAVRDWVRARLQPDPFGGGPHGDTYRTTSLYYDTMDFDVYWRRGSFGRSKYRIRYYGSAATVFLERKLNTHDKVSKRRSIMALAELHRPRELGSGARLAGPLVPSPCDRTRPPSRLPDFLRADGA
jgi:VTC domain-containing protein